MPGKARHLSDVVLSGFRRQRTMRPLLQGPKKAVHRRTVVHQPLAGPAEPWSKGRGFIQVELDPRLHVPLTRVHLVPVLLPPLSVPAPRAQRRATIPRGVHAVALQRLARREGREPTVATGPHIRRRIGRSHNGLRRRCASTRKATGPSRWRGISGLAQLSRRANWGMYGAFGSEGARPNDGTCNPGQH